MNGTTPHPDSGPTARSLPPRPPPQADETWQVGEWTFRPLLHRLSRDGEQVRLEPKVSDLLLFLAQRVRQPVTKDALIEGVWEQKFLGDSALTRTMAELRRALGDDARSPAYVETIPKLGYRLIAAVRRVPATTESAALDPGSGAAVAGDAAPERRWRRLAPWLVAAVLLLALASLVAVPTFRPTSGAAPSAVAPASAERAGSKLVAVLPLADLSQGSSAAGGQGEDEARDFFAAGMTEALVTHLARTGSLGVISHHSVDRLLAADEASVLDRARELGIDAVVEGTVQRAGERVRITVRLTELEHPTKGRDTYSWAETYERDLRDVLALQAEVSHAIADEVRSRLGGTMPVEPSGTDAGTVDPQAYELYLQARHALSHRGHGGLQKALDLFTRSIELAPDYAPAHAGLGRLYAQSAEFGKDVNGLTGADLWQAALAECGRALELDPGSAEALAVRGMIEIVYRWDWQAAERDVRRALQVNPSDAYVRQRFAFFLTFLGRFDEAAAQAERAAELDPLSQQSFQALAHVYFHAGRYDDVHAALARAEKRLPQAEMSVSGYGTWALAMQGRYDEALERMNAWKESGGPADQTMRAIQAWVLAHAGRPDEALEIRRQLDGHPSPDPFARAILEAGLRDRDAAFAALEQALDERSRSVPYLKVEPFLRSLHDDPRFDQMVARLGL